MLTHSLCFPSLAKQVLRYAARFAADWVCLELLTHTLYFPSLAKHRIGMRYSAHGLRYGPLEIGTFPRSLSPFHCNVAAGMVGGECGRV